MAKKLYRSTTNRKIWGVCGGLGDHFDIDPVLVRIIFVALAFAEGLGILLYILLAIFVPKGDAPAPQ
jgi:phage shock protein PspC (stress-responsive transcriptional regulator)